MRKRFIPKAFFVVAALAFAAPAIAQQRTVVSLVEPATSFYRVGKAEVSYFAGSNTTEVRIELPSHRLGDNAAGLWFVSQFAGKDMVIPKEVSVGLRFRSDKARLQKLDQFALEADEEPLKLANLTIEELTFELDDNQWARAMRGTLGFAGFQRLVTSKTARLRISGVEFVLDQKSREALRDMLKAFTETRPKS